MRFVDAFLFSEPHESDVLWVKLNLGADLVDEWVVVENSHTHQGEPKDYYLNDLLRSDTRFSAFKDRIHVIETNVTPKVPFGEGPISDDDTLQVSIAQREAALPYLLDRYDDDDRVLVSDSDECLDSSDPRRRELLVSKVAKSGDLTLVPRIRYWFDYDNCWLARRCVPLVSIRALKVGGGLEEYRLRWAHNQIVWRHNMVFEYSHCFPRDNIVRKIQSFIHTGLQDDDIDDALRYNLRPRHRSGGQRTVSWTYQDWFVTRRLNRRNSPEFVREHLDDLRTGVVDPQFRANRRAEFPEFFPANPIGRAWNWARLYGQLYRDLAKVNASPVIASGLGSIRRRATTSK